MKIKPAQPRDVLNYISPYQPGKPISEVQREYGLTEVIKLASNENHLGPAPSALKALRRGIEEVHLYPDGAGYELKNALAEQFGFEPEEIILGNGSTEIVEIACESFLNNGDGAVTGWPAFFKYRIAVRIMGAEPVQIPLKNFTHDLERMLNAVDEKTKMIFIADPNNPTGTLLDKDELEAFIKRVPEHIVVVLDQAYYEFIPPEKRLDAHKFIRDGYNLIVLRTFSKIYGLAGLRVGYGFARPEIIAAMNKVREAFNCSSLAQIAAAAALQDSDFVERTLEMNRTALMSMYEGFDRMRLEYIPSATNFVLVDFKRDIGVVFEELLKRGVIVRPMKGYDLPASARISTAPLKDIEYFLKKLDEVLKR
ncbi:MAG: histidinol-phosphate transaminase [candidate division Zixibacteria bacterium]|nr:histidinol-phosphate transaminase [Candidatus Tariuqbacter arcticus]